MDADHFLRLSFTYAIDAKKLGDGPYGALILDEQNEIIARAGNTYQHRKLGHLSRRNKCDSAGRI